MAGWSYERAMGYLNNRTNYEKKWPSYGPVTFNLERMKRLNALLGNPQDRYPSIHITGTKGKGSTAAILASVLQSAGLKVGVYTSPHLVNIEERIRVNGLDIPKDRLAGLIERVSAAVEFIRGVAPPPHPTFFEIFTTAAFCWFAQEEVDWAVVEVGLGGRLDSTNIVTPRVSVVTHIGLDHTNILGDTVAEIATEKAGIIKQGVPVVTGPQEDSAERVLRGRAGSLDSPVWGVGREVEFGRIERRAGAPGSRFDVKTPYAAHTGLEVPLVGAHQAENAAVAVGVIDLLRSRGALDVSEAALVDGLARVEVAARIEVMSTSPLIVIDGAHNPLSMHALVRAVRDHFEYRRLVLLYAMATDKDIAGSLGIILPLADEVFFTVTNSPRAARPDLMGRIALSLGHERVTCEHSELEAFRRALAATGQGDMLLITGSRYLAGDLRPVIQQMLATHA